jgi:hypothetical protein
MSIKVMTTVWEHSQAAGTDLLVLLALADIADDNGECWPSMAYIGRKARLSARNARARIASLRDLGEVIVIKNGGKASSKGGLRSNLYQITVHMPASDTDASDRITDSDTDASDLQIRSVATGLIRMPATADTSLRHVKETSFASTSSQLVENDVDPLRHSVLTVCGWESTSVTSTALGSLNKALKDLRSVGATAEDVHTQSNRYLAQWSTVLTPTALAKHWASLAADSKGSPPKTDAELLDDKTSRMRSARALGKSRAKWDESKLRDQPIFQTLPPDEQDEVIAGWRDAQPEPALVGAVP